MVGDIISSLLGWDEFRRVAGDPAPWTPTTSRWAPADGRPVTGSAFARLWTADPTGQVRVPDLRGQFLRGLNGFDPQVPVRDDAHSDPTPNRIVGSHQASAVGPHAHELHDPGHNHMHGPLEEFRQDVEDGSQLHRFTGRNNFTSSNTTNCQVRGPVGEFVDRECRPHNVAVYYYVQIN